MTRCTTPVVFALYFTSGAAALIYEVSWARQIGELLGHSAPTAGVVLAAYFIGLALGYGGGGWCAARIEPLRGYALAEASAAVWALVVPLVLSAARRPAVIAWLGSNLDPAIAVLQAALCLLLLLPATIPLGATLPFMAEFLDRLHTGNRGVRTILAYSINTLGAVCGVVLATGVLLVNVGVSATSWVGAALSAVCALVAFGMSRKAHPQRDLEGHLATSIAGPAGPTIVTSSTPSDHAPATTSARLAWTAAVSGFVVLGLEVLYLRLFSLVLHNSSYSFAAVLVVFLTGLSAGAALVTYLGLRWSSRGIVTTSLGLGAVGVVASVYLFGSWTRFGYWEAGHDLQSYLGSVVGLAAAVMLPPVVLLGMTLPALWNEAHTGGLTLAARVGRLSTVNTLAAAAGSLAVSFWLLPQVGLWNAFALLAGIAAVTALIRLLVSRRSLCTLLAAAFLTSAIGSLIVAPPDVSTARDEESAETLQRWETAYGWIDVVRNSQSGALDIRQNLHYRYGSTGDDAIREQRQAHLPLLLHPQPREALFLGLGTGVTAAGATRHADLERITVVELIPEVVAAARWLGAGNLRVTEDPRVRLVVDDARHYLAATDESYDVVVGDLFVPWESETGYLYTQEHFERIASRLKPGGVCCQWLALYQVGPAEFRLIADTFASVFPETTLWWGYLSSRRPIVALVGSNAPLQWDAADITRRCERLQAGSEGRDDHLSSADRLLESLIGRWETNPQAPRNTVERPRVEFTAPYSQAGNELLQRGQLQRFLSRELAELSPPESAGGLTIPPAELQRLRGLQRYVLFGD